LTIKVLLKDALIQGNAAQYDIRAIAVLATLSEYGQHAGDILYLPAGIVADAAGKSSLPGVC
jgi:hypothetical protein